MSVPLFGIDSNLTDKISIPKACMVCTQINCLSYHHPSMERHAPLRTFITFLRSLCSLVAFQARIWLLSAGFSLSVGMMIVRVVYTAFMELVREFKSYQVG